MRRYAAVVFILVSLAVPVVSAATPDDARQADLVVTSLDLNMTGINITNHSIPSRYGITPTLIDIKVQLSDSSLPGPKGEMATGPRTIGFAANPVSLMILVVAIIAGAAGAWFVLRRKPEEHEGGDEEGGE